jgi:iron uptake system EfeUOB component EfeO/EfeM
MLFSNANREQVQEELETKDFAEVSQKISELWKNIDGSSKAKFEAKSEKAKAKCEKELAKYKNSKKYEEYQTVLKGWKMKVKEQKKALKEAGSTMKKVVRRRK